MAAASSSHRSATPAESLKDLVTSERKRIRGRVVVFSIPACKHCKAAKSLLEGKGVPFIDVNLEDFPGRRAEVVSRANGSRTVPQIFLNEKHIGGNSQLQDLEAQGVLDQLLVDALLTPVPGNAPLPPSEADIADADAKKMKEKDQAESGGIPILRGVAPGSKDESNILALLRDARRSEAEGGLPIRNRWQGFQRYYSCFSGNELVEWLMRFSFSGNRQEAGLLGQRLMNLKLFHNASKENPTFEDGESLYRFYQDDDRHVLNATVGVAAGENKPGQAGKSQKAPSSASDPAAASDSATEFTPRENAKEVAASLRKQIADIYSKYLLTDGSALDYDGVAKSEEFSRFALSTCRLNQVDVAELTLNERKATFINLYNALIIHGNIALGTPTTMFERSTFFSTTSYMIGGLKYSLNDIEHGILRGNKSPPFQLFAPFGFYDPRRFHILPQPTDPRIHFALNCGAKSCPAVKLFSADQLDEELDMAAFAFCEDKESFEVDANARTIYLSKIFYWYEGDFGADQSSRLRTLSKYLSEDKAKVVRGWLESDLPITLQFRDYDWSQNSTSNAGKSKA